MTEYEMKYHAIPKHPDGDALTIEFAGGFRAWKLDEKYWHFGPIMHNDEPKFKGPIDHSALRNNVSSSKIRALGFNSIHWDNGVFSGSWKAVMENEKNHMIGASDLWQNISSNMSRARTEVGLRNESGEESLLEIERMMDEKGVEERLSHSISICLRSMDSSVRDIAYFYNENLINLLRKGHINRDISMSTDVNLYSWVQSFFMQLGAARDFLFALIAHRIGFESKVDSMAKLLDKLRRDSVKGDAIFSHLVQAGLVIPAASSSKFEASGWLLDASEARNNFIHRRPYGSRFGEKFGRVLPINPNAGIYRYHRNIVLSDGQNADVLDYICDHYRSCVQVFFDCARLSVENTSMLGRVDKTDSPPWSAVIQDHLYVGGDLGTQPDVRRRMGIF